MRNGLKSLILGGVAALALSAATLPAFAQTKTLKFVSWQKDERGVGDWWASVIKGVRDEEPRREGGMDQVERGAYADTMTTRFSRAESRRKSCISPRSSSRNSPIRAGWRTFPPYIKSSAEPRWMGRQSACQWKGKPVCVMMLYFGNIFAYNEEMLKKEGLNPPTNWAEYIAAARKLTKDTNGDGIPDQFGTGHETKGGGGQYLSELMNYTLDAGGRWTDANGKVTINTPQMIEGLARWKEVVKNSLTPRDLSAGKPSRCSRMVASP